MARDFDYVGDDKHSLLEYAVEHWDVEDVEMILNDKLARGHAITCKLIDAWTRSAAHDPNMLMLILDFDEAVDPTVLVRVMTSKVDDELAKIACVQRLIHADVEVPPNIYDMAKSKDMKEMLMSMGVDEPQA